jgi:fatty-acid desaturase
MACWGFFHLSLIDIPIVIATHYIFAFLGASLGLHKYASHRLYTIQNIFFHHFILLISTLCLQGPLMAWAINHRKHHLFTNQEKDPHNATRGFLWSHVGWLLFQKKSTSMEYQHSLVRDLQKDPLFKYYSRNYFIINLVFYIAIIGASVAFKSYKIFFILGPIRTVTVWHATWLVNSLSHSAGPWRKSPIGAPCHSRLVSFLIPGEGDHEFHHNQANSLINKNERSKMYLFYVSILKLMSRGGLINFKV